MTHKKRYLCGFITQVSFSSLTCVTFVQSYCSSNTPSALCVFIFSFVQSDCLPNMSSAHCVFIFCNIFQTCLSSVSGMSHQWHNQVGDESIQPWFTKILCLFTEDFQIIQAQLMNSGPLISVQCIYLLLCKIPLKSCCFIYLQAYNMQTCNTFNCVGGNPL